MKVTTVESFIENRVQPEHRELVEVLRTLMRETAPGAREVITYGVLAWRGNLILAVISPTKKDITFAFSKGAAFEDKSGLLKGVGKEFIEMPLDEVEKLLESPVEESLSESQEISTVICRRAT